MTLFILSVLIAIPQQAHAAARVDISRDILNASAEPFISYSGPGAFDTALVMNLAYPPIVRARGQIEAVIGKKLDFFKLIRPEGEAHITVITPVEYWGALKEKLSIQKIEEIALKNNIQKSGVKILGVGSGAATLNGQVETTFFLIVHSRNLIKIRKAVQKEFVRLGGNPDKFSPEKFYPHVTIGYTKRDLHIQDGVIKDAAHSLDKRFSLRLGGSP